MQAFELAQLKEENISLIRIESSHTNPKKGQWVPGLKRGCQDSPRAGESDSTDPYTKNQERSAIILW